ncbi:hypothetical protein GF324_01445 [bacterium]|nr:hypothetical protein [bacterium]
MSMLDTGIPDRPSVHFIGIGGTGMVSTARLAVESGWEVRGSDNPLYPPTSEMVKALNVKVYEGYAAENLDWNPSLVVIGNAVSRGHVEVEEVLRRGIPYTSFPEWIKHHLLWERKPVVITGTHGKTTTSSITAYLLDRGGKKPGYLIGGQLLDFPHSSHAGAAGCPFVIEGDEYDTAFFDKRAKFFHYLPHVAIITSVEFDHGDIYRDLDDIKRSFRLMLRAVPPQGWVILCADQPNALELREYAHSRVVTYGFDSDADWRGELIESSAGFQGMVVYRHGRRRAELAMPLFGRHNAQNVLAAVVVAALSGIDTSTIASALLEYKGVKRRMQVFHEQDGITYVDDFGHHPTAIRETLAAARLRWPDRRLLALIEPRSNTMVTNRFQNELADVLRNADEVVFAPIHRPERMTPDQRLNREAIRDSLEAESIMCHVFDDLPSLEQSLSDLVRHGDVAVFFSNGSFGGVYRRIVGKEGEN